LQAFFINILQQFTNTLLKALPQRGNRIFPLCGMIEITKNITKKKECGVLL
jgi:hypothetical protein